MAFVFTGCETIDKVDLDESSAELTTAADNAVQTSDNTASDKTLQSTEPTTAFEEVVTHEYNPTDVDVKSYNYSFSLTDFGKVISMPDFNSFLEELQTIVNDSKFKLAFCYKNIETGAEIKFNENTDFLTCSTIKPAFVKSLLESGVDPEAKVSRTTKWPGDYNYVASLPYGTELTVKELMQRAVSYSDNSAYYLLHQRFGASAFNENQQKLNSSIRLPSNWIFTYCTAYEALNNYVDIYNYIENGEHGEFLKKLMTADDVDVNMQVRKALEAKYTVAEKYGSEFASGRDENQFHSCDIVFAESPYVLTIFTNQYPETEESAEVFRKIAVVINKINTVLYIQK